MMKKIATLFIMSLMVGSSLKANLHQEFEVGLNTWEVRHPIIKKFREQPFVWGTSRTVIKEHPNASFEEALKLTIDKSIQHFIKTYSLYSDLVEGMDPVYRKADMVVHRQKFERKLDELQAQYPVIKKFREQPLVWGTSRTVIREHPNASFEETLGLIIQDSIEYFRKSPIHFDLVKDLDPVYQEVQTKLNAQK
ncbi:MAG: hypothetical protein K2W92_06450 [Alphaproteobacteria bacterium]|nr:hypothetical protein [Alphaproteobacteria bacterium]